VKIKLTPELAYLIGFWRKRRSNDGLGVYGEQKHIELFIDQALNLPLEPRIATSDKILTKEDTVFTHNTAYKKFFQEVEEEELERFKYLNEYAANYLAGIFDAAGFIDEQKGIVRINKITSQDEILFLRLGFITKRSKEGAVIGRPRSFLAFIKNYVKLHKDSKVFQLIKAEPVKKD
jgi:hypothetical protein